MKALGKLIVALGIIGGCAYIFQYVKLITKLKYEIGQIRLKYFSLANTQLTADLVIRNDGYFSTQIESMIVDVYLNEKFVSQVTDTQAFMILPASTTVVPVVISFNPESLGQNISSIINMVDFSDEESSFGNINIKFEGKLTTKFYGIPFIIPFSYSDKIKNLG